MSETAKVQEQTLKDCFIITPIGAPNSETFKSAHGLIQTVLSPVLLEFGYNALPAYKINAAGSITKQVIEHVVNDELVIANLTGLNPNVMYELALRHAYKKKVITLAESGTSLPFDISDQRTIFYEDNFHGTIAVKEILRSYIKEVLETDVTSNPVIDSVKEAEVINSSGDKDGFKYLLNRFDRLERLIDQNNQSLVIASEKSNRLQILNRLYKFKVPKKAAPDIFVDEIRDEAISLGLAVKITQVSPHELTFQLSGMKDTLIALEERVRAITHKYQLDELM